MEDLQPILTRKELKKALDLSKVPTEQLQERFKKIAKALLTEFAIKKGKQLFYITDIEFYYYSNDHKDFITYPRKCHAGEWFFHSSGVDITFESHVNEDNDTYKPVLDTKSKFGGILIRSIKPSKNTKFKGDFTRLKDHPLNVSDFLFDHFDALTSKNRYHFPILKKCAPHAELPNPCERYIKITDTDKKFENIKKYNYARIDIDNDDLKAGFNKYLPETGLEKEAAKLRYKL